MKTPSFPQEMSVFFWKQVLSVFAPGALVGGEAIWALSPGIVVRASTQELNGVGVTLAILVATASFYALGLLCRSVGFWRVNKIKAQTVRLEGLLTETSAKFGLEAVEGALKGTVWTAPSASSNDEAVDGLFQYAKFWLRAHAPANGVDHLELEINIRAALAAPLALLVFPVGRSVLDAQLTPAWSIAFIASCLVLSLSAAEWILRRGRRLKELEPGDALARFVASRLVLTRGTEGLLLNVQPTTATRSEPNAPE